MKECKGFDPPIESHPLLLPLGYLDPNTPIFELELGKGRPTRPRNPNETRHARRRQRHYDQAGLEVRNRRLKAEREAALVESWRNHQIQQLRYQRAAITVALLAHQRKATRDAGNVLYICFTVHPNIISTLSWRTLMLVNQNQRYTYCWSTWISH